MASDYTCAGGFKSFLSAEFGYTLYEMLVTFFQDFQMVDNYLKRFFHDIFCMRYLYFELLAYVT